MTSKLPRVAILMATFNGSENISEQIYSIKIQEGVDANIFISDDESTDRTIELLEDYTKDFPQLNMLPKVSPSGGAGQNFFRLIRDVPLADYKYFAFADQDDIWMVDKLSRAINQLVVNNAQGYSSSVIAFWSDGRKKLIKKHYPIKKFDYFFEAPGPGCSFVMTRDLFLLLKQFVIANQTKLASVYYHDWFVYAFTRSRKLKWVIDNQSRIDYRQHEKNNTGANSGTAALILRTNKIWSFWARDQVYEIAKLLNYEQELKYYFSTSLASKLRLCRSFFLFRRAGIDCFALLILGLMGKFKPPQENSELHFVHKDLG
jgi:rhamnosyltransferase